MINDAIAGNGTEFDAYYGIARDALLGLWPAGPEPHAVLEIGCGAGALLAATASLAPRARRVGVELRPEAAAAARRVASIDEVVEADVLDATHVDFAPASFDVVLASHVLEHFADPQRVLARLRRWLAPGGCLLVALPNARHLSLVFELVVRGDFRYRSAGLLDRTHLRFFTRRSALRFFDENGWRVEVALSEVAGPKSRLVDALSLGMARDFAAYAHLFRLRDATAALGLPSDAALRRAE